MSHIRCSSKYFKAVAFAAVVGFFFPGLSQAEDFLKSGMPDGIQELAGSEQCPRFTELVKILSPAVVNISVESTAEDEGADSAQQQNPFLRRDPDTPFRSLGSGFIVQEDGYIVTNNHVIDKSERIIVRLLDDKTEYDAKVIGKDLKTDIALLKISSPVKLKTVYLGNSDTLEVGEWVFAIGNQFQLGHTVSAGIISALSRKVHAPSGSPYDAYIQTDASINPGSSGGPLFNTKGQVIGVNTAIFTPGRSQYGGAGFNIGIGFAMPINVVKSVLSQLKDTGRVTRGLLGVIIQPIDADVAAAMGIKTIDGALVADVMENSPAAQAGFQKKDIIISFDGKKVKDYDDLPAQVGDTPIGKTVKIEVLRDGVTKILSTTIAELKDQPAKVEPKQQAADAIGLVVGEITGEITQALGKKVVNGVAVFGVDPGSRAARAGVERGDVIEELAGKAIRDVLSYQEALKLVDPKKPVLMLVRKKEGTRFLVLRPKHISKDNGRQQGENK